MSILDHIDQEALEDALADVAPLDEDAAWCARVYSAYERRVNERFPVNGKVRKQTNSDELLKIELSSDERNEIDEEVERLWRNRVDR